MPEIAEGAPTRAELAELARSRASFYAFLNVHFLVLPDKAFVQQVRGSEFASALQALVQDGDVHPDIARGAREMQTFLQATQDQPEAELSDTLGVDRTRLYRGVAPGYGPPPPYEAVWTKEGGDTGVLQRVAATYREAGLGLGEQAGERIDYIGVELDYMRQLALREAGAWEANDEALARETVGREHAFARNLRLWAQPFIAKALEIAQTDFYRGHLHMVSGFLEDEEPRLEEVRGLVP